MKDSCVRNRKKNVEPRYVLLTSNKDLYRLKFLLNLNLKTKEIMQKSDIKYQTIKFERLPSD